MLTTAAAELPANAPPLLRRLARRFRLLVSTAFEWLDSRLVGADNTAVSQSASSPLLLGLALLLLLALALLLLDWRSGPAAFSVRCRDAAFGTGTACEDVVESRDRLQPCCSTRCSRC